MKETRTDVWVGVTTGAEDGTPSVSNSREPLFLISYVNLYN